MSEKKDVLIVEDDPEINELLSVILKKDNIQPIPAYSGTEALLLLKNKSYDLILLDLMLPGMDGEELIEQIRKESAVPIIVISAKVDIDHKVHVLKSGADDYITKPFNKEEVLARVNIQLRKVTPIKTSKKSWRDLLIDGERRSVTLENKILQLTNAEFDILTLLVSKPEHVFSKRDIYEQLWTGPYVGDDNTISVHISNIRRKMAAITNEEYIKTIWGVGFQLI